MVSQIAFKPDWNAAPFKRNDLMLESLPVGASSSRVGIVENLGDKAQKTGIPVWRLVKGRSQAEALEFADEWLAFSVGIPATV